MRKGTQQQEAIRKALIDAGRPLSVDEVLRLARGEVAGLGIATVYRNLKALQLQGQIAAVDLPGQPPRWEMAPGGHHHHFLCRTCNKLFEVQDCPRGLASLLPEGCVLEAHDILLRGLCSACHIPGQETPE